MVRQPFRLFSDAHLVFQKDDQHSTPILYLVFIWSSQYQLHECSIHWCSFPWTNGRERPFEISENERLNYIGCFLWCIFVDRMSDRSNDLQLEFPLHVRDGEISIQSIHSSRKEHFRGRDGEKPHRHPFEPSFPKRFRCKKIRPPFILYNWPIRHFLSSAAKELRHSLMHDSATIHAEVTILWLVITRGMTWVGEKQHRAWNAEQEALFLPQHLQQSAPKAMEVLLMRTNELLSHHPCCIIPPPSQIMHFFINTHTQTMDTEWSIDRVCLPMPNNNKWQILWDRL